jgi:dihydropteroate synthase
MNEIARRLLGTHRFGVLGIVNVTPDSFSDGGLAATSSAAVDLGLSLADAGVEAVDVGGESTRPGAAAVDAETERGRVVPVIEALAARRPGLLLSIDTSKVEVARAALDAGASVVNDVTAAAEPGMLELVAGRRAALVLMHMRGTPRTMQLDTSYDDVIEEVRGFLLGRADAAKAAGVDPDAVFLDPGIGFGKGLAGNLALLRGLPRLAETGYPLLIGTSRKAFLGAITGAPVDQRLGATLASLLAALTVERIAVRVHDAAEVVRFRAVIEALGVDRVALRPG